MVSLRLSLLVSLVLLSLLSLSMAQDPTCRNGIIFRGACCPKVCGRCGGTGCYQRSKANKTKCCADGILRHNLSCRNNTAPCVIPSGNTPISDRTPAPNGGAVPNGAWVTAPIRGGALVKRHEACALMVRGMVVLIGGRGANKPVSMYNPRTKVWTTRPGPGAGIELHHMQCVATSDGRIWMVSSWRGGFPYEKNNDKIYIYNVVTKQWSTKAGMPEARRRGGAASILHNGVIYVIGGNRGGHGAHAQSLSWMDSYAIGQDRWKTLPSFPAAHARDHTGGAVVNGELCIAGGRDGGSGNFFRANVASTWCYSLGGRRWRQAQDFPSPRAGANTGRTCDGRMTIAGGEGDGRAYNLVHAFDGQAWRQGASMREARHGSGLAIADCSCGQIFVPSGSGRMGGSPELLTTEQYVPNGEERVCERY